MIAAGSEESTNGSFNELRSYFPATRRRAMPAAGGLEARDRQFVLRRAGASRRRRDGGRT